jgi:hypothetical protein
VIVELALGDLIRGLDDGVCNLGVETEVYIGLSSSFLEEAESAHHRERHALALTADPARLAAWAARLGPARGRRIGLAWAGSPGHANDHNRSAPLAALAPILGQAAEWIALHKDALPPGAPAGLRHFGPALVDFAETAALIAQCDMVISVDTSIAHLAACLGKPVWLLLATTPDWRWGRGRADSPWSPTMRLFRQARLGDWAAVAARVAAGLRA